MLKNNYAQFEEGDRVAFAANPAFDASTLEVWAPLLNGGCIVVIGQETLLDPVRFGEALRQYAVSAVGSRWGCSINMQVRWRSICQLCDT